MRSDIVFGLVPVHDDDETWNAVDALRVALERSSGRTCDFHLSASPGSLVAAYESGAVNMVWSSPTLALTARELRGAVPVVSAVRQGVAHYHGVLFVRRDSAIQSALQLRGSRAAWVAPTSAAGFIFPRVALAGHGIDPESLYAGERFLGSHGAVVRAVLDGEADVGATFAVFEDGDASKAMIRSGFLDAAGGDAVRVILSTPPIPADLVLARPSLIEALGESGLVALWRRLAVEAPDAVFPVLGADDFAPCDPRSLAELRRQLDDAQALGLFE